MTRQSGKKNIPETAFAGRQEGSFSLDEKNSHILGSQGAGTPWFPVLFERPGKAKQERPEAKPRLGQITTYYL